MWVPAPMRGSNKIEHLRCEFCKISVTTKRSTPSRVLKSGTKDEKIIVLENNLSSAAVTIEEQKKNIGKLESSQ